MTCAPSGASGSTRISMLSRAENRPSSIWNPAVCVHRLQCKYIQTTVEPLIMDTLKRDNLPTMDKLFTPCPYIVHTFLPPKKGQPLNNGQNARPQPVHYSEVPLYSDVVAQAHRKTVLSVTKRYKYSTPLTHLPAAASIRETGKLKVVHGVGGHAGRSSYLGSVVLWQYHHVGHRVERLCSTTGEKIRSELAMYNYITSYNL